MNELSVSALTNKQAVPIKSLHLKAIPTTWDTQVSCLLVSAPLNKQASVAVHILVTLNTQTSRLLGSALTNKQVLPQ